jgi:hypothetical protein
MLGNLTVVTPLLNITHFFKNCYPSGCGKYTRPERSYLANGGGSINQNESQTAMARLLCNCLDCV